MKSVHAVLAALFLLLFGGRLAAADAMKAILVVPDSRILPGVPFDFWIELHNDSLAMSRVSVCAPFQMRLVSGEPFEWTETAEEIRESRDRFYWPHGGEVFVNPGETKVLAIPAEDTQSGRFFRDRRFSAPGRRFSISLSLCEQVVQGGHLTETSALKTSEAEIELVNPTGSDAVVWSRMQEARSHRWTPAEIWSPELRPMWESIIRESPDSNYVPYAVLMAAPFSSGDRHDVLALELRTIRRFPDSPAVEWLHVQAWRTAGALSETGVMLAEGAMIRRSKRPTTKLLARGNVEP